MNNDLISRKWLTDAIRNRRTYLSYEDAKDVIDLIDNAPTVERQQGEWVKIGDIGLAYTCNKCGEVNVIPTKFCPNCGAYMQKGGAE